MTLSEILYRLKQTKLTLPTFQQVMEGKQMVLRVTNIEQFRRSIRAFAEIPPLIAELEPLLNHQVFATNLDGFAFDPTTGQNFHTLAYRAQDVIDGLIKILPSLVPHAKENCIRVKLPDSSDYRGVITDQESLLKALEQMLFISPEFNKSITIEGWENGSLWLVLCVGLPLAVEVIGRAVWAAAVIRKKMHEGTIVAEKARALKVEVNFIEHVNMKAKEAVNEIVDTEALAIYEKYFNGENPHEEVQRIKLTLETLASLIDRGAEVHPALMEPEKAHELFPDFKALNTISSQIKQLEQNTP